MAGYAVADPDLQIRRGVGAGGSHPDFEIRRAVSKIKFSGSSGLILL